MNAAEIIEAEYTKKKNPKKDDKQSTKDLKSSKKSTKTKKKTKKPKAKVTPKRKNKKKTPKVVKEVTPAPDIEENSQKIKPENKENELKITQGEIPLEQKPTSEASSDITPENVEIAKINKNKDIIDDSNKEVNLPILKNKDSLMPQEQETKSESKDDIQEGQKISDVPDTQNEQDKKEEKTDMDKKSFEDMEKLWNEAKREVTEKVSVSRDHTNEYAPSVAVNLSGEDLLNTLEKEQKERTEKTTINDSVRWSDVIDLNNFRLYEWLAVIPALFLTLEGGPLGGGLSVLSLFVILRIIRKPSYSVNKRIVLILILTLVYYSLYFSIITLSSSIIKAQLPYKELIDSFTK